MIPLDVLVLVWLIGAVVVFGVQVVLVRWARWDIDVGQAMATTLVWPAALPMIVIATLWLHCTRNDDGPSV